MGKAKYLLLAAIVSTAMAMVGATPQPAAAEVTAVSAFPVPDGTYPVRDENGTIIGYVIIRNNQVIGSMPAN
jgi:hypothetical protein